MASPYLLEPVRSALIGVTLLIFLTALFFLGYDIL